MDWGLAGNIAQVFSVAVLVPVAFFNMWRRIDTRLTNQDERLIRIEAQFHRNGGTSLRDSIDRMDRDLARLTGRFDNHVEEYK